MNSEKEATPPLTMNDVFRRRPTLMQFPGEIPI